MKLIILVIEWRNWPTIVFN